MVGNIEWIEALIPAMTRTNVSVSSYIIDWEAADYDPDTWARPGRQWSESVWRFWHLARRGEEPQW